ncbi:MAG: flagellar biosynthetic protein FliR [Lachnospiraceae bacterium]|nr:flagellar biosynthetic protein FliR [Lachnospiraceae bacterium]HCJ06873.1 flagellar biosynthetic protein FliR [Lachnospiraceae bacterium]
MIEQTFSIYHLEYYLAIFVRVMGAIAFAPIFGNRTVTRRVRIFIGIACALAVFTANPYVPLGYSTFLEYTILLLKELIVGITIGFMSNVTLSIINAAGQFIDREIGFSMVSDFDPGMNTEITITAEFYNMLVMLIMLCSNMHYFILSALSDSFQLIPLGNVTIDTGTLYDTMVRYIADYFIISVRIALPVMIAIMLLNVVLGVLAKTAPQMNMFVIGMQLKIFVGFAVLFVTIGFLPNITEYIYKEMQTVVTDVIKAFM